MDLPLVELGNAKNAFPQIAQARRLRETGLSGFQCFEKQLEPRSA